MNFSALFFLLLQLDPTGIEWTTPKEHDFELLRQNVAAKTDFKFINRTEEPLVIDAVRTTCGCTAADYPEDPVMPGEKATIGIEYDAHRVGYFSKKVKVYFHGRRKPEVLTITGEVQ